MNTTANAATTTTHRRGETATLSLVNRSRQWLPGLCVFTIVTPILTAVLYGWFEALPVTNQTGGHPWAAPLVLGGSGGILLALCAQLLLQLRKTRHALSQATEAKSDFLANVSHEIRTPMNGLLGMTSLLLQSPLSTHQRGWAETVQQSAETLLDVINDVIDIAKIEAGELGLEAVAFDLYDLLQKVTDLLAQRARNKGIQLLVDFQRGLPRTVVGDALRLRQIIVNLVGNAIKFTERGTVVIRVLGMTLPEQKIRMFFAIEDTGVGIAPEKQQYIFEKFTQGQGSTTRRYGGMGLGLTISRYLIEQFNGTIDVQSEPDKGSTFSFTLILPLAQAATASRPDMTLQGVRVLVVEPLEIARTIIVKYLVSWGMKCDAFASAGAALKHCAELPADDTYRFALVDGDLPHDGCWALVNQLNAWKPAGLDILTVLAPNVLYQTDNLATRHVAAVLRKPLYPAPLQEVLLRIWRGEILAATTDRSTIAAPQAGSLPGIITAEQDSGVPSSFPGVRVLLVEDQPVNQMLMKSILERAQCVPDLARNGIEAVAKFGQHSYDLIFMDCQMPEMDGFQATQEIRRLETNGKRTPIVAVTADAMKGDRDKCLAIGMDDYLNKPVQVSSIHAMIHKYSSKTAA